MKLSKSKVIETLRKTNDRKKVYQARKVAKISVRRVYQVKEVFERTGKIPEKGKSNGVISCLKNNFLLEWKKIFLMKFKDKQKKTASLLILR